MRKNLLKIAVVCAACAVAGAQAQAQSPGSSQETPGSSSSQSGTYESPNSQSQSGWRSQYGATGRMSHKDIRASQLTGAEVTSSSGTQVGTISDAIVNPASGRIDFAIVSLSQNGSSSANTSGSSSTTTAETGGSKEVAVPWMLLRPSSTSTTTSATGKESFKFAGNPSKLDSAPAFDPNTDLSQPSWRQSVFSYFGLSGHGMATGSATSPGSTSAGSSSSQQK